MGVKLQKDEQICSANPLLPRGKKAEGSGVNRTGVGRQHRGAGAAALPSPALRDRLSSLRRNNRCILSQKTAGF